VQEELKLAPVSQEVYVKKQRPDVRVKEFYKPVPKVEVQGVVKSRPKVVEIEEEVAVEVPQVRAVEIYQQKPKKMKQRLIQAANYHKEYISREEAVLETVRDVRVGDIYEAPITGAHRTRDIVDASDIVTTQIVSEEVQQLQLRTEKHADFLKPVHPWMADQGEIVDIEFYTEQYLRQLAPERLQQIAMVLYTKFGTEIAGQVPEQVGAMIQWILTVQAKTHGGHTVGTATRELQPSVMTYGAPVTTISQPAPTMMTYGAPISTISGGPVAYAPTTLTGANLFNALDTNHDGVITRAEFVGAGLS
jgi:hypothetical protein